MVVVPQRGRGIQGQAGTVAETALGLFGTDQVSSCEPGSPRMVVQEDTSVTAIILARTQKLNQDLYT